MSSTAASVLIISVTNICVATVPLAPGISASVVVLVAVAVSLVTGDIPTVADRSANVVKDFFICVC